jgi:hypothetical protein
MNLILNTLGLQKAESSTCYIYVTSDDGVYRSPEDDIEVEVTKEVSTDKRDPNTLYNITDDFSASTYEAYSKTETDALLAEKTTETQVDSRISEIMSTGAYAFPGSTHVDLTLDALGTYQTAPANGWAVCRLYFKEQSCSMQIISKAYMRTQFPAISSTGYVCLSIPVAKGQEYKCETGSTGYTSNTNCFYWFIYAKDTN